MKPVPSSPLLNLAVREFLDELAETNPAIREFLDGLAMMIARRILEGTMGQEVECLGETKAEGEAQKC